MPSYGVGLFGTEPPQVECALTELAESLGYANVWFGDSQLIWRETYVTMGAAARATSRIIFGTGVTNLVTRHLSVLASAWITLAELTQGRVILGVGAGDSSLQTMGMSPLKLGELERRVGLLRRLMAGEEVEVETGRIHCTFAGGYRIPVYIAASSPKILELSGKIGDGVIMLVGTDPRFIAAGLDRVRRGAEAAGRRLEDLQVILWTPTSILPDPVKARDVVRAHVARVVIRRLPADLDAASMAQIARIREAYDYYHHMDVEAHHGDLVPDALVDHFALAGNPDEVREQLRALRQVPGIDQIAIIPYVPAGGDRGNVLREFAALAAEVGG